MTKEEFENTDEALGLIVSLDPESGEVLYDTYPWKTIDGFLKDFEKDFPNMVHFSKLNASGLDARKKFLFGL